MELPKIGKVETTCSDGRDRAICSDGTLHLLASTNPRVPARKPKPGEIWCFKLAPPHHIAPPEPVPPRLHAEISLEEWRRKAKSPAWPRGG